MSADIESDTEPDTARAPDASPPRGNALLWIAIIAHLLVLAARAKWVETDPDVFRNSAFSSVGVFLLGPAALVALALGVPSRWDRARMWRGVAVAWLVTAVVHGLIVLGAVTGELPTA